MRPKGVGLGGMALAAWALAAMTACDAAPAPIDASLSDQTPAFDGGDVVDVGDVGDVADVPDLVDGMAPSDRSSTDTAPVPSDRGPLVPLQCPSIDESVPTILGLNPATNCPTAIAIQHGFSSPNTCDVVRACCNFAPACEFDTQLTLNLRGPCPTLERSFPQTHVVRGCHCVDGVVVCYGGDSVTTWCLDCDLGVRDSGVGSGDVDASFRDR